jgi:vacuolar-type H+-ATPase subunit H
MAMTTQNGKVKEIWGRQFRIVKNGLDESDVFSFVGRLIEENQELAAKLEHVSSLRRLAERAVVQAAKEAGRIKQEAQEQANTIATSLNAEAAEQGRLEATRLISEAEQSAMARISAVEQEAATLVAEAEREAAALADKIIAEARQQADERAAAILTEAEQEGQARADRIITEAGTAAQAHAESSAVDIEHQADTSAREKLAAAEDQANRIIAEAEEKARAMRDPAADQADKLIAEARQSIEAAESKAQEILAEAQQKADTIKTAAEQEATSFIEELKQKADHAAEVRVAKAEEEGRRIIEESIKTARLEAERIADEAEDAVYEGQPLEETDLRAKFEVLLDLLVSSSLNTRERPRPAVRPPERRAPARNAVEAPRMPDPEVETDDEDLADDSTDLYHGPVEIDFPPPLNSGRVLKIHKALARTPNLKVIDLEGSSRGGIRIRLYVNGRVALCDVLREMPDVERVTDGVRPSKRRASEAGGRPGPRRVVVATRR